MFSPASLAFYRYPAPGFRHQGTGALDSAGEHGASRSASHNSTSTLYLAFRPYLLYPSNTAGRAYGFQLRCLSE